MEHVSILLASAADLPRRESLDAYLQDVAQAESRGYFTPEEDERLREVYGLDGNAWQEGPTVRERLRASFDASFAVKKV